MVRESRGRKIVHLVIKNNAGVGGHETTAEAKINLKYNVLINNVISFLDQFRKMY